MLILLPELNSFIPLGNIKERTKYRKIKFNLNYLELQYSIMKKSY